ncbi:hypothetical protein ACMGDH_11235 [Sphingomonas sp. DT-207]|uniref:hypothetical protein n=1 Tax=Sphingomonas sp. DT-207 TaxID=3396167 RepID=UPI003F1E231A
MSFPVGIQLAVLAGNQEVPTPIGPLLADLLIDAEVVEVADGQCLFRLTFGAQRDSTGTGAEVEVLADGRLSPGNRVLVMAMQAALPTVLIDGLVTDIWLDPGTNPGASRIVVSGADLSVAMDLKEQIKGYPDLDDEMIVLEIIAQYERFAIVPETVPPIESDFPTALQRTPIQHGTDLEYIYDLANRYGYVFTMRAGPVPLTNTAYWGPPKRVGMPAPALTVGDSTFANVDQLTFSQNGRAAFQVVGLIPGPLEETPALPIAALEPTLLPPLALKSPFPTSSLLGQKLPTGSDGFDEVRAMGFAQGRINMSSTRVANAEGVLDVKRYGSILRSGGLVGVRGAGTSFDGMWNVTQVTHKLRRNEYKQQFVLGRDGIDPIEPVVLP